MVIVGLGDSTTAGAPAFESPREAPPDGIGDPRSQYAYRLMQRHPEWRVLNRGVSGERTDQILKRFDADVVTSHPQIVIILAGVNDLYQGSSAERVTEHLRRLYERARQHGIDVLACTILPYNGSGVRVQARMAEVNGWIRDYARAHSLELCDLFPVMEDPEHPGGLRETADGIHPDVDGYRRMGDAIADTLEARFAQTQSPRPGTPASFQQ